MLGTGSSGLFRRHLLQIYVHRRRERVGGKSRKGGLKWNLCRMGNENRLCHTQYRQPWGVGGQATSAHQKIARALKGQHKTWLLSMAQVGKLISAAGQMCPHSLHPVLHQNLSLLGAQQGKSCDKVTSTRETLSQACGDREKSQLAGSGECLLYFRAQKLLKQSLSKFTKEFCFRPRWKSQRISTKTIGTCETNAWFIKLITKLFITYFCLGVTLHFSSGAKSFVFSITVDFCNTLSFEICFKSTSLDWSKAFGFVLEVSCFQQQVPISKQNCKGTRRQSSPLWEETKQPYTSQVLLIKVCGHLNLVTEFSLCFSCKWRITVSSMEFSRRQSWKSKCELCVSWQFSFNKVAPAANWILLHSSKTDPHTRIL